MTNIIRFLAIGLVLGMSSTVWAQSDADTETQATPPPQAPQTTPNPGQQQPATHPVATTYSDAYEVRLKIHKYASYATLPLFATELALGQSLYNNPDTGGRKAAHAALGTGLVGLFGVNSVTGVWNLWEGRHDENGRKLRILHSVLMLAANGGIVAASATAPNSRKSPATFNSDARTHRDIAVASIGVGTVGYLIMLFKGK
jgi:hypothetical protein